MTKSMKDLVAEARTRVETISPADAQAARPNGDVILDVREPAELDSDGAIAGAIHIPRGLLEAQADPDTGKAHDALVAMRRSKGHVNVLCASGARAALAADVLKTMGYNARVIEGGLGGWKQAGLPITA
ncbi:MAG: rhodanese-like domain-containing protein [Paracoccus sp. (in: a-proteobacteria)]|jgi:rhodanese-related sulfurtransferase|uniref:rhodanese-like domain-containing protein n=1 Tax=unclassified Paracoccus (in: a-proteobacteria) TaxID=2688777 RepID=UPI0025DAB1BF|nr:MULTISPECIES: rhodanese-like domain-containing protein [unclassified Paracoccus (in: a-proteobacteria)]MCS5603712.1 rhodanese-like domain-containing protein [Paracoccus sp. (in: a-proteobacteria)]|tara:strand:+ start:911 stop:1297 length:387 start_codon:yes stop_codon:yes gene_type:complete